MPKSFLARLLLALIALAAVAVFAHPLYVAFMSFIFFSITFAGLVVLSGILVLLLIIGVSWLLHRPVRPH